MFRFFENLVDPYIACEQADAPPRRPFAFMREYSRPFRGVFPATAALKCVSAALDVALIWYVGRMVDLLAQGAPAEVMRTHGAEFALAALVVLIVRPVVSGIDVALLHNTILVNYGALFRWRAIRHVLRQSAGWFENDPTPLIDGLRRVDADAYPHETASLPPRSRKPRHADIALHSHQGHRVISGRSWAARRAAKPPEPSGTARMTAIPALPAPQQHLTAHGARRKGKAE